MNYLNKKLRTIPFYLFLVSVFFVLHVLRENYRADIWKETFVLGIKYLFAATIIFLFFWLIYKNYRKAAVSAFLIMSFHLFFGSAHDFFKHLLGKSIFIKYSFFMPAFLVLFVALAIYLKKTKREFLKLTSFFNCLFLVLIFMDIILLLQVIAGQKEHRVSLTNHFEICDSCAKPDIYLIVADEYAGKKELHDLFGFDNTPFEKALQQREFHVLQDPRSNYNATVYSIASMLDMGYMKNMTVKMSYPDIFICRDIINNNNALSFFKQSGYKIYNYTFFDLDDKEEAVTNPFFREKKHLFTVQTFTERVQKDIGYNFAPEKEKDNLIRRHFYNNRMQDSLTRKMVSERTSSPKFVYTHFAMPHHPYYTDSNGKEFPLDRLTPDFSLNKGAYIEYLIYANKKLLDLIDYIKNNSAKPPIIILMSDHGFRQFSQNTDKKYYFMNLNAVYFPDKNYGLFYNGMSNVNQFRVILNSQFRQKFPLLKDSTIFLPE